MKKVYKNVDKVMKIVVEQILIITHAFNYRFVCYVLVFPLQLAYCICYYQPPLDYLNVFELAKVIDWHMKIQCGKDQMT